MGALAALGHPIKIEIEGNTGVSIELRHQAFPGSSVWFCRASGVKFMHNIVRDFMRHRIAQIFLEILGKYPWVVTD